jgi:hypothetical protein
VVVRCRPDALLLAFHPYRVNPTSHALLCAPSSIVAPRLRHAASFFYSPHACPPRAPLPLDSGSPAMQYVGWFHIVRMHPFHVPAACSPLPDPPCSVHDSPRANLLASDLCLPTCAGSSPQSCPITRRVSPRIGPVFAGRYLRTRTHVTPAKLSLEQGPVCITQNFDPILIRFGPYYS